MNYEVRRENFDRVIKAYKNYISLYRLINGGEIEGISSFEEFYLRFTYYVKYQAADSVMSTGS